MGVVVKFVVWEVYKNTAALKTHSESKAFAGLVAGILRGDLLERPPIAECTSDSRVRKSQPH